MAIFRVEYDLPFKTPSFLDLCRVSVPLDQVQRQNNSGCYEQQVNQAIGDKATVKSNQPQEQQHYKNCPQHESYLLTPKCSESFCLRMDCANTSVCALDHIRAILFREVVALLLVSHVCFCTCHSQRESTSCRASP